MALRNQLKNVKIQNAKHLEVVQEEAENAEVVIATLNGLLGSWDSFMQGICDYFQLTLRRRRWEQLKIKLSPSKEDPSSDEEYEEINS